MEGQSRKRGFSIGAAILAAAVLVSASLVLLRSSVSTTVTETSTSTTTSVSTTTETAISTSISTSTVTTTSISTTTLPGGCSPLQGDGYYSGALVVGSTSPAVICVQFYWFAATQMTPTAASLIQIEGVSPSSGQPVVGPAANFTIAASTDDLSLGGPTNSSEGTVVAYSINARPGASGTYQLRVDASVLGTQGVSNCGPHGLVAFDLVEGNGQPNYLPPAVPVSCIVMIGTSQTYTIPGLPYNIPPNTLCYRIISMMNSTQ